MRDVKYNAIASFFFIQRPDHQKQWGQEILCENQTKRAVVLKFSNLKVLELVQRAAKTDFNIIVKAS